VAGGWGNYGDLPTAIIMSVTAVSPFQPADQDRAVAYIAAFLLLFMASISLIKTSDIQLTNVFA